MSAKKQSIAKRACADCHFISISKLQWDNRLGSYSSTAYNYELAKSGREQVRRKEAITIEDAYSDKEEKPNVPLDALELVLTCYKECWTEFHPDVPNESYEFLVETDRSDCIYFFKYRPSMTFDVADEHIQMELLKLKQSSIEGNRMDSNENDSDEAGKDSIIVDSVYNLLKYKEKEVKIEPFPIAVLELLYKNKNSFVTRKYILDHIWKESKVSDDQVSNHIQKIRKAFEGLGYENDIITTVKKSIRTEGGYRFNSNIASLDFH